MEEKKLNSYTRLLLIDLEEIQQNQAEKKIGKNQKTPDPIARAYFKSKQSANTMGSYLIMGQQSYLNFSEKETSPLILSLQAENQLYSGEIQNAELQKLINKEEEKMQLNLALENAPKTETIQIKLSIAYALQGIDQETFTKTEGGLVSKVEIDENCESLLIDLSELEVSNTHLVMKNKSVQNNEIQKSEMFFILQIGQQRLEFDIENPIGDDKKNPDNACLMIKIEDEVQIIIEERIFKLERDEQALLESIKTVQSHQQVQTANPGLLQKASVYLGVGQGVRIKKKKILEQKKIVFQEAVSFSALFMREGTQLNLPFNFSQEIKISKQSQVSPILSGTAQVQMNSYSSMPRGFCTINIKGITYFSNEEGVQYEQIMVRFLKLTGEEGEKLAYQFNYEEVKLKELLFDTLFFDDYIKIEIFQKNSLTKINQVGKAQLQFRKCATGQTIQAINIIDKKSKSVCGSIFFTIEYQPRQIDLFDPCWKEDLVSSKYLDKIFFFDDHLVNEYRSVCHFGYLTITLNSVMLPSQKIQQTGQSQAAEGEGNNIIFILKLKVLHENLNESNQIIMIPPNEILNPNYQKFYAKTSSLNDKISIELYEVLSEEAFNPNQPKSDFKNMRLLAYDQIQIKNIPFNEDNQSKNYQILLPVLSSGKVASFNFDFSYQRCVPEEQLGQPVSSQHKGLMFFKMLQNDKKAMHVNKDLERYQIIVSVENVTQGMSISKRIFFNKVFLPFGFIEMKLSDHLKLGFYIIKPHLSQKELLVEYEYEVTEQGLKGKNAFCQNELIQIRAWQPVSKIFEVSLTENGISAVQQKSTTKFGTLPGTFARGSTVGMGAMAGGTIASQGQKTLKQFQDKIILEGVCVEMEYRTCSLTELYSIGQIESCLMQVYFKRENILDLLLSRDISENGKFEVQNVSQDKRAIRDNANFYINEVDFEMPFTLRIYNLNDQVQIKIQDVTEHIFIFKLAELPLSLDRIITQFFQLGSKQIQLDLALVQDTSLIMDQLTLEGEIGALLSGKSGKGVSAKDIKSNATQNLQTGQQQNVQAQKESIVILRKLQVLDGKTQAEQIKLLKQYINEQSEQNKQLITKQNRLKKEHEKVLQKVQEATTAKPAVANPNVAKDPNKPQDVNKMLSGVVISGTTQQENKNKQNQLNICACGSSDPYFKGYCKECVVKLKKEWDRQMERFKALAEEYDSYSGAQQQNANQKIQLMKNKIAQYEIQLNENEVMDVMDKYEKILKTEENRNLAEYRVSAQSMKQEIELMKVKQDIELNELKKHQQFMETQVNSKGKMVSSIQTQITDLDEQLEKLNADVQAMDQRIGLKKKFIVQQQKRDPEKL